MAPHMANSDMIGGCLRLFWQVWARKGKDPWVSTVLKEGYQIPFLSLPPLSSSPVNFNSYQKGSPQFLALEVEIQKLIQKAAVEEIVPPLTPGFYSRIFVVKKREGEWRPIIDLSILNLFIRKEHFKMETSRSVLQSIHQGDWMASLDLQDAYLQVPVHPHSSRYLRFVWKNKVFQFRALCFGLSTAPLVFTRICAEVAALLHLQGIRLLRYLDDWLLLAGSEAECHNHLQITLNLCHSLGLRVNWKKSVIIPAQLTIFLGMRINSKMFRAFPSEKRKEKFLFQASQFLRVSSPSILNWESLLGLMASLMDLVKGGQLRMRPLQFHLQSAKAEGWDQDHKLPVPEDCRLAVSWWLAPNRLDLGVSLKQVNPDILLETDASTEGWGAHSQHLVASGLWSPLEKALHINILELRAVKRALQSNIDLFQGRSVALLSDNTTALAYLSHGGGNTFQKLLPGGPGCSSMGGEIQHQSPSQIYSGQSECSSRCSFQKVTAHRLRMGTQSSNLSSSLGVMGHSRSGLIRNEQKQQAAEVLFPPSRSDSLENRRFPSKLGRGVLVHVPPIQDTRKGAFKDINVHKHQGDFDRTMLAEPTLVSGPSKPSLRPSKASASVARSVKAKHKSKRMPPSSHFEITRMEAIKRGLRKRGFSEEVASFSANYTRESTRKLYEAKWRGFLSWCHERKEDPLCTSLSKLLDFFWYLKNIKKLSVSAIQGYRAAITPIIHLRNPKYNEAGELDIFFKALNRTTEAKQIRPPHWDVNVVLSSLKSTPYEPFRQAEIKKATMKTIFLVAMATANRVGEIQALSDQVGRAKDGSLLLSFNHKFIAKTNMSREFNIPPLSKITDDRDELLLCPVRAIKKYLKLSSHPKRAKSLFVSPRNPTRPLSQNACSAFLREVIFNAYQNIKTDTKTFTRINSHEIRGVATSLRFKYNLSQIAIIKAAYWRSNTVFASNYLRDISHQYSDISALGPLIVAQGIIQP